MSAAGSAELPDPPGGDRIKAPGSPSERREATRSQQRPVPPPHDGPTGLDAVGGLARVSAELARHTGEWALRRGLRSSTRLLRAATSPREAASLALDVERSLLRATETVIRVTDLEQRLRETSVPGVPAGAAAVRAVATVVLPAHRPTSGGEVEQSDRSAGAAFDPVSAGGAPGGAHEADELRERGEELIRLSRDVHSEEQSHPAYDRIVSELAPDEGRILLLMLVKGPQPAVDVRTGGPLGLLNSELIAPGLSMIGSRAGLRYRDRVPAYLNNLFRLGLVWFSRETLPDPLRYQVLEAQPDVLEASRSVRHAKIVRRSIHLTPFGEDFCRTCLPVEQSALVQAPTHTAPPEAKRSPSPPALGSGAEL